MSNKRPLVVYDGRLEELRASDAIIAIAGAWEFNADPSLITKGNMLAGTTPTVIIGDGSALSLGYDVAFTTSYGNMLAGTTPTVIIGDMLSTTTPTSDVGLGNSGTPTFSTISSGGANG